MFNYFDAPGCASLYNDQAITPLGPYQHNVEDLRHTKIAALRIDPAVTVTLPRQLAFPDSIVRLPLLLIS